MPRLHPRTLLRVARQVRGTRAVSSRPPPPVEWALDESYNLPFLSRAHPREQPVASSSKHTLDSFLGVDPHSDRFKREQAEEDVTDNGHFADDADLLAALTPSRSAVIAPSDAYNALRQSPLFSSHLRSLAPRIRDIYSTLRTEGHGTHNILVSDLLLRCPSPVALRFVLVEEATHFPKSKEDPLRKGLIAQAYRAIGPSLSRRELAPLTPAALAVVSRALMAAGHQYLDELEHAYYQLAHVIRWTKQDGWPALEILLHMSRHGRAEAALKCLSYPISTSKLPAAMGRTTATHSEPATLLMQSAVVRCALFWGLDERAYRATDALVTTMSRTAVSGSALELVLAAIRGASARRRPADVAWAGRTLLKLAHDDAFPPLSTANVDMYYAALRPAEALAFYSSLPQDRVAPPRPHQILRMALARPAKPALQRLAVDLARTRDAAPTVPGILSAMASARMLGPMQSMYKQWRAHHVLDGATTLAMVSALTRGARTARNSALARAILADYMERPGVDTATVALQALVLITEPKGAKRDEDGQTETDHVVAELIERLVTSRGVEEAQKRLDAIVSDSPALAHRLAKAAAAHGLTPPRAPVVFAALCAAGHWNSLAGMGGAEVPAVPLTRVEEPCVTALRKARQRRVNVAAETFAAACAADTRIRGAREGNAVDVGATGSQLAGTVDAVIPPTAAALLHRTAFLKRWEAGFGVLRAALPVAGGDSGVVDAAAVFISALGRDPNPAAAEAFTFYTQEVALLVAQLQPAPRVLLETMLERAGSKLGVTVDTANAVGEAEAECKTGEDVTGASTAL